SPIVNAKGDVVGLLFDGNYEGLPSRYFYDSRVNRSVSVDVRAIVEALDKVYDAKHLVKEVLGQ
ncbi:MAG TPA: S46 family peptidase, partial [Holophaga sp.]|nr:S46 family peptidase [Holophaga sp.]